MKEIITQNLETIGVSYNSADIFRLIDSGWNVNYKSQHMIAFRTVLQCHTQNGEDEEDNDHSN